MKRFLLVTLQDNCNIGNRLQNYALQRVIEQHGGMVTNLDNGYTPTLSLKEDIKNIIKRCLVSIGCEKYKEAVNKQYRRQAIEEFTNKYISNIKHITYEDAFDENWNAYNLAIVGSDQVWHRWRKNSKELPYYYLEFLPNEKRVSYAASFGFEKFPPSDREEHIKGLLEMREISCREQSGCVLVEAETGRTALQVLDPTLLLNSTDWRSVEGDISQIIKSGERFAFVYFLGDITEEYRDFIDSIAKKRRIRIIDFMDMQNRKIAHCGVGEFIRFIDHADYVFTDSFHCTVFSVIFNKKFTVFRRKGEGFEKMFSRIEDLLSSTGKLDCIYGGSLSTSTNDFVKLREASMRYLDQVLSL